MSVAYPSCLYIRIERDLRTTLKREAQIAGVTVSELARSAIYAGLVSIRSRASDARSPSAPTASMRSAA